MARTTCPNGHTDVYISGRMKFSIGSIEIETDGNRVKLPSVENRTIIFACRQCGAKWSEKETHEITERKS